MFKEIGAKFVYKGFANFNTPRVTEDIRRSAPDHSVEALSASRIFLPTEEGQIFAGVFADVVRKSYLNLAVGAYLDFQNVYDEHYVACGNENVFAEKYRCFDGSGKNNYYYFKRIFCEENNSIMIYNPCYKKCVVLHSVLQDGLETYVECSKTGMGIKVGFITMKPGISLARTRVLSGFLTEQSDAWDKAEAERFYQEESQMAEFDLENLMLFGEGSLIDICMYHQ